MLIRNRNFKLNTIPVCIRSFIKQLLDFFMASDNLQIVKLHMTPMLSLNVLLIINKSILALHTYFYAAVTLIKFTFTQFFAAVNVDATSTTHTVFTASVAAIHIRCMLLLLYAVAVVCCYILLLLYTAAVVSFCFYYFYYKLQMHTYAVTVIMHKKIQLLSLDCLFILIMLIYYCYCSALIYYCYCSAYCIATALVYYCYCSASYMHYSNDYLLYCCHGKILLSAAFFYCMIQ